MIEEQNINQLPRDWKWMKLGEVCLDKEGLRRGPFGSAIKKEFFVPSGYKVYEQSNAIYNDAFRGKYFLDETKYQELINFNIQPGDLIVSCSGTLGRIAEIPANAQPGVINQALLRVRLKEHLIEKRYFLYNFRSAQFQKKIFDQSQGTAMSNLVGIKDFKLIEIFVPSKPTQQAIVSKIEELFSELDKGIEQLKTAQQQLKTYRQSVLKWAFEGKLANDNVKDGELPEGWKWVKFGELFSESPQNGLYKSSTEYGSGTRIMRIDGFYDGIILSDYLYKRVRLSDEEINRYEITVGDILVNRVNSMPYLGKCGIVKHLKERTVFESNIMKVRVKKEVALPEYLTMYLSSKKGITEFRKNAKQAVNQASINQTDVSNVIVPLPLIQAQKNIVQKIEIRLSVADKMEESITQSLQQAEALRQSILKKAFEGRLV